MAPLAAPSAPLAAGWVPAVAAVSAVSAIDTARQGECAVSSVTRPKAVANAVSTRDSPDREPAPSTLALSKQLFRPAAPRHECLHKKNLDRRRPHRTHLRYAPARWQPGKSLRSGLARSGAVALRAGCLLTWSALDLVRVATIVVVIVVVVRSLGYSLIFVVCADSLFPTRCSACCCCCCSCCSRRAARARAARRSCSSPSSASCSSSSTPSSSSAGGAAALRFPFPCMDPRGVGG